MKPGAEYEQFVYAKLKDLFKPADVKVNDTIRGKESGLDREIDISIRHRIGSSEVLFIVQCKDWKRRVDINTLGALSAVMQDVGADKGFLLCSSGFYATNHDYARVRNIELFTIEDMNSDLWSVEPTISIIYTRNLVEYLMHLELVANPDLVKMNRDRPIVVASTGSTLCRIRGSSSDTTLEEYTLGRVKNPKLNARDGMRVDLTQPELEVIVAGVWVQCSHLSVVLHASTRHYQKYVTAVEYSQLRDHRRGTTVPLRIKLENVKLTLDETYVEVPAEVLANFPGLCLFVEEQCVIPDLNRPGLIPEHRPLGN